MRRKSILVLLLIIGIFMFSSCDINIFSRFEDIPEFSADGLEATIEEDVFTEDGDLDLTQDSTFELVIDEAEGDGSTSLDVNEGVLDYLDQVDELIDNEALDDVPAEDLEQLADNMEVIVEGIMDNLNIDLDDETDLAALEGKSFEEIIEDAYGTEVPLEDVQEIRAVVQQAAAASAAIRLEANQEASTLLDESTTILLSSLGSFRSTGGTPASRTLVVVDNTPNPDSTITFEHLAQRIQIVMKGKSVTNADQYYVLYLNDLTVENAEPDIRWVAYTDLLAVTPTIDGRDAIIDLADYTSNFTVDLDHVELTASGQDDVTVKDLLTFVDTNLGYGDGTNNIKVSALLTTIYDTYKAYIPDIFADDGAENKAEGDDEENPVAVALSSLLEQIDITDADTIIKSFNDMASSGRAFLATLDLAESGSGTDADPYVYELTGLDDAYLTGGSLNGDGLKMAILSLFSIPMDYIFRGTDDPTGILEYAAYSDFKDGSDGIVVSHIGTNPLTDYMRYTINYLPGLFPHDYNVDVNDDGTPDFPGGLQTYIYTGATWSDQDAQNMALGFLGKANIVKLPYAPPAELEPSARVTNDLQNFKKIAALFNLVGPGASAVANLEEFLKDPSQWASE